MIPSGRTCPGASPTAACEAVAEVLRQGTSKPKRATNGDYNAQTKADLGVVAHLAVQIGALQMLHSIKIFDC